MKGLETIRAYEDNWEPSVFPSREDYKNETTLANTPEQVIHCIKEFALCNHCNQEVTDLLDYLTSNIPLLNKTHVVTDGSYRNCTIVIRPDGFWVTHKGSRGLECLKYFEENAETLFLVFDQETWEECHKRMRHWMIMP